jgi:hypothetical protein
MRWLFALIIIVASFLQVSAEDIPEPGFTKLTEALIFIDHKLDAADWEALSQALYPPLQLHDPNRTDWTQLKEARGKLGLASIYADKDFPTGDDKFLINVPRATSIGGSRIRFIKANGEWRINAVYIVR